MDDFDKYCEDESIDNDDESELVMVDNTYEENDKDSLMKKLKNKFDVIDYK